MICFSKAYYKFRLGESLNTPTEWTKFFGAGKNLFSKNNSIFVYYRSPYSESCEIQIVTNIDNKTFRHAPIKVGTFSFNMGITTTPIRNVLVIEHPQFKYEINTPFKWKWWWKKGIKLRNK